MLLRCSSRVNIPCVACRSLNWRRERGNMGQHHLRQSQGTLQLICLRRSLKWHRPTAACNSAWYVGHWILHAEVLQGCALWLPTHGRGAVSSYDPQPGVSALDSILWGTSSVWFLDSQTCGLDGTLANRVLCGNVPTANLASLALDKGRNIEKL